MSCGEYKRVQLTRRPIARYHVTIKARRKNGLFLRPVETIGTSNTIKIAWDCCSYGPRGRLSIRCCDALGFFGLAKESNDSKCHKTSRLVIHTVLVHSVRK